MTVNSIHDELTEPSRVYKYRDYSARSLEMLIRRELYFAKPEDLNDPYDCQFNIHDALARATEKVEGIGEYIETICEDVGVDVDVLFEKIQNSAANIGVLSFSKNADNSLMWSHYSDSHKGFCIGFDLNDQFSANNLENKTAGASFVDYDDTDPYENYFVKITNTDEKPSYNDFWVHLLALGVISKSEAWGYEKEARVIREEPGVVIFEPSMLVEIVFGLNMPEAEQGTIRTLLSDEAWEHVEFKQIKRTNGFKIIAETIS